MIISLSGKKQVGKDTAAKALLGRGFKKISFAGPLKSICSEVFGLDFDSDKLKDEQLNPALEINITHINRLLRRLKDEISTEQETLIAASLKNRSFSTRREILQYVGTDVFRKIIDDNVWINYAKQEILNNNDEDLVITDARFPNERKMLKELGAKLFLIKRPGTANNADTHASENSLGTDEEYDVVLENASGIQALQDAVMFSIMPKETLIVSEATFTQIEQHLADAKAGKIAKIDLTKSSWIDGE